MALRLTDCFIQTRDDIRCAIYFSVSVYSFRNLDLGAETKRDILSLYNARHSFLTLRPNNEVQSLTAAYKARFQNESSSIKFQEPTRDDH